jgi:hypothetical protein
MGCKRFGLKRLLGSDFLFSNFSNKELSPKAKDSNAFNPNLNRIQTRIKSNKLFRNFSNLEIDLNVQI